MHPKSPYTVYQDFKKLAKDCPRFAPFVDIDSNVDFQNPAAVRELAKSFLLRDFGLDVELPEDRLCPMIPNRLDYVLWIQDLVDSSNSDLTSELNTSTPVTGLDVGTGASCVYPLLACSLRPSWRFIATDIDHDSLQSASGNVARNELKLRDRIRLHESAINGPLFPLDELGIECINFTMCNPPFYSSVDNLLAHAALKSLPPSSACTGTLTEMVYVPNGELGFAKRMLQESLILRTRIQWYTTLFGNLSSVLAFIAELKAVPDLMASGNWAVTDMVQGATKRWAVAWSFGDRRPAAEVAVSKAFALKGCSPPLKPELEFSVARQCGVVEEEVAGLLGELELIGMKRGNGEFYGEVKGNVWSRAARRAMAKGVMDTRADGEVQLGFLITVSSSKGGITTVNVRWKRGQDGVLFERFCGMVKRKIQLEK
ncbi:hypothetical protein BDD12DRAFT_369620 [Trichophaea hybrida]|nr:hypothetical protein BDD12DRAFT_369620 [Trichophaea hybrida]